MKKHLETKSHTIFSAIKKSIFISYIQTDIASLPVEIAFVNEKILRQRIADLFPSLSFVAEKENNMTLVETQQYYHQYKSMQDADIQVFLKLYTNLQNVFLEIDYDKKKYLPKDAEWLS